MRLWEKIYWTVAIVCFILIIAFAVVEFCCIIPMMIFAVQIVIFILYMLICKLILGLIWGLEINLFTLPDLDF